MLWTQYGPIGTISKNQNREILIINDSHAINQKTKKNFKKRQAIFETILAPFNLVLGKNVFQKVNIQGNYAKKKEKSS